MSAMQPLTMNPGRPDADIEIRDAEGRIVGAALGMNPLAHAFDAVGRAIERAPGNLVLLWSGWMGEDRNQRDLRNWGPDAWARLEALVDHLDGALEADWGEKRVLLRPVARGVMSDTQRCRKLFFERPRQRIGLALEPCALLEPGMLPLIEDHLARAFDALGGLAGAVVLGNVRRDERPGDPDDAALLPAPVQAGLIPPPLLGAPARELGWAGVPVILVTNDRPGALHALDWNPARA